MAKYDHGGGCPCGLQKICDCEVKQHRALLGAEYWDIDDSSDEGETKQQGAFISSFDDLCDHVHKMSMKDQKDLAESILQGFFVRGWSITGDYIEDDGSFNLSKTETL